MRPIRFVLLAASVTWGLVVALRPGYRKRLARRLLESRRFVSRRIVDRDARDARGEGLDRWANEGGWAPGAAPQSAG